MSIISRSTPPKSEGLILFTRYPEPAKTKTRLIPALGPEGAAELQRQMTEHTLKQVKQLKRQRPLFIEVRYAGGSRHLVQQWLGRDISCRSQDSGSLGERMRQAFQQAFEGGMERVLIIGTDCPGLVAELIQQAFTALEDSDLVLGPAEDGGYYLIGLKRAIPQLFAEIPWGMDEVRKETLCIAEGLGLQTHLLEPLRDIDRPQELQVWQELARNLSPGISIIIPTLNEEANIAQTLAGIPNRPELEVIVADGGSSDKTVELARSRGARVFSCVPGGRAGQMNAGALLATKQILLFLHADTCLPPGFEKQVQQIIANPKTAAGAFGLRIDGSSPGLRLVEKIADWRSRVLQMPYGDQAIFLKTRLFHQLGGFSEFPIMEDFELIRRLRQHGQIVTAPLFVITSGRRWQALGIWRTTLINQVIVLAYFLGFDPSRLVRWYR